MFSKLLSRFTRKPKTIVVGALQLREDINSNTTATSKNLYRIEEIELQAKILELRVDKLDKGGE